MKLKGIELKGTYEVRYYDESFVVYNEEGKRIYYEDSYGYWSKNEYDEKGNQIYFEKGNGFWSKREYNEKGNAICYENNNGKIIDIRVKELTIEEIENLLGYKIKIKRA